MIVLNKEKLLARISTMWDDNSSTVLSTIEREIEEGLFDIDLKIEMRNDETSGKKQ